MSDEQGGGLARREFLATGGRLAALGATVPFLADMQMRLPTLTKPSTIPLSHSLESDLHSLKFSHARRIDTALRFTTCGADAQNWGWHGLRVSGSAGSYRTRCPAFAITKRLCVRA